MSCSRENVYTCRYKLTVSLLSNIEPTISVGWLLSIQSLFLCQEYVQCWKRLCGFIDKIYSAAHRQNNLQHLIVIFQICFLGCNTALCVHKVCLAEYLGYR